MLGLVLFAIPAGTASALPILVSPSNPSGIVRNNGTGNAAAMFGYKFQSSSAVTINHLGIWDGPTETELMGLGLETGAEIGIWLADTEVLLGTTLLGSGTSALLLDGFRYGEIDNGEIELSAGVDYIIAAFYTGGGNAFLQAVPDAFTPNVGISGSGSVFGGPPGSFGFPGGSTGANFRWAGPNATFVVPEPSTGLMLGLGLGCLAAIRRRNTGLAA